MAIVNLYRVTWHRTGAHNNANTDQNTDFVVAATTSKAEAIATTIQTNNGDGKTVAVDHISVERAGVIQ